MGKEELLQYHEYLNRLAASKCTTQQDAEDLVSETMLAAYAYVYHGGTIEYPKTWLANTLMHKYNSILRKKYRIPLTINIDTLSDISDDIEFESEYLQTDEASEVRHELIYLTKTTREVLIKYYFGGSKVADIALQLGIPEGTVKSRLSAGRNQVKKGLEQMDNQNNNIPGKLYVSNSGSSGLKDEPISLVEGDLIAQNLLIFAYDKPLTATELSRAIGIPTVYIEPKLQELTDGELMVHTDGDKYYTDFIIYKPEDFISRFDTQLKFVHDRFNVFWSVMSEMIGKIDLLEYSKSLNSRQLKKLERYVIIRTLQNFQLRGIGDKNLNSQPNRRDGGHWTAMGNMIPAGYDDKKIKITNEYVIQGGHRTSGGSCDYQGAKYLQLCEFDTTLWDNPRRFTACGFDNYFNGIINFLWCVFNNITMQDGSIKNAIIESIDNLINSTGLIARENGKLTVDIPVMNYSVYNEVTEIINSGYNQLIAEIGMDYKDYLKGNMIPIPPHLKSVTDAYRYSPATSYIVMAAAREAYEKKLHLHDVNYCCPPVVLVYKE